MEVITDIKSNQSIVQRSIDKHGHAAEHNLANYLHLIGENEKHVFLRFEDDMGIMASVDNNNNWSVLSEVLAPEERKMDIIMRFLDYSLTQNGGKKVVFELLSDTRKELLKNLREEKKFRACKLNYSLYWPIFSLKDWDEEMNGKAWKKLRNVKNKFLKSYNVKIRNINDYPSDILNRLVDRWIENRKNDDGVDEQEYYRIIKSKFEGYDSVRIVDIEGKPCAMTAGWKIPNTNMYYSSIGVYDPRYEGVGVFANIDDLNFLKQQGFEYADFGGSDKSLLNFKKKFKPETIYSTHIFSVVLDEKEL